MKPSEMIQTYQILCLRTLHRPALPKGIIIKALAPKFRGPLRCLADPELLPLAGKKLSVLIETVSGSGGLIIIPK